MGYNNTVFQLATGELSRRRQAAEREATQRRERVIEKQPAALEYERIMRQSAGKIARAFLAGGDMQKALAEIQKENEEAQEHLAACIAAAGEPGTDFSPVYTCPLCEDTGFVHGKMCSCLSRLLATYAGKELSRSTGMKPMSFDTLDETLYEEEDRDYMHQLITHFREYGEHFDRDSDSLLLFGPTGTGKTHFALSIAGMAIERGFSVVYGPIQTLFRKLEKEHFGRAEGDTLETLLSCDLLVLDDVGTERNNAFTISCLYDILNSRMIEGLPTIISTNLTAADWSDRYGEAIASRVLGTYDPWEFPGKDIRLTKMKRRNSSET